MRFHHRKAKFRNAQNRFCNRFCNKIRDRTARMMRARWAQRDEIHGECLSQCLKEMPTMFPRIGAGFGARLENGTLWNRQAFASLLLPAIGRVTMFASFQNWVVKTDWIVAKDGAAWKPYPLFRLPLCCLATKKENPLTPERAAARCLEYL